MSPLRSTSLRLTLLALAAAAAVGAAWVAGPALADHTKVFPLLAAGLAALALLAAAALLLEPAWILSVGVALSIFSGDWGYLHDPIPLDRVVIFTGLAVVVVRSVRGSLPPLPIRRVHLILAVLVLYAFSSAAYSNTLSQHAALFDLIDRLGFVPFMLYLVAPIVFSTPRHRRILLLTLVVVGAYLSLTAFFEIIGPKALVFPSFIKNPLLGTHESRARGPFLEAGSDGLAMFSSMVAAAILFAEIHSRRVRALLVVLVMMCLLGIVLTLTRQVWIGAAVGAVVASLLSPRLRRYTLVGIVGVAVFVGLAFVALPGSIQNRLKSRTNDEQPVWARLSSNNAALRMFESRPLLGYGWGTFVIKGSHYYHVANTYPLLTVPAQVHNVVLSNAAELGAVGAVLWLCGLAIALLTPFRRRGPPELEPWKLGLVAIAIAWFTEANLQPLSYAFANYIPWLFAGVAIAYGGATRTAQAPAAGPVQRSHGELVSTVPG